MTTSRFSVVFSLALALAGVSLSACVENERAVLIVPVVEASR